jgi:maltose O-acetyltransferase
LDNWIITKVKNQIKKLNVFFYNSKLKRFKNTFKRCGENTFIQFPVRIEGANHIDVGNNVSINAFVHIWGQGNVTIGDDCLIASHVSINSVTHDTNAKLYRNSIVEKEVVIGNNVWIGSHAIILPGIKIGNNAIIGAGALVNKNVPSGAVVAGVPAKIIKYINE